MCQSYLEQRGVLNFYSTDPVVCSRCFVAIHVYLGRYFAWFGFGFGFDFVCLLACFFNSISLPIMHTRNFMSYQIFQFQDPEVLREFYRSQQEFYFEIWEYESFFIKRNGLMSKVNLMFGFCTMVLTFTMTKNRNFNVILKHNALAICLKLIRKCHIFWQVFVMLLEYHEIHPN